MRWCLFDSVFCELEEFIVCENLGVWGYLCEGSVEHVFGAWGIGCYICICVV